MINYYTRHLLALFVLLLSLTSMGQTFTERPEYLKANSNWFFNAGSGTYQLDFNTTPATATIAPIRLYDESGTAVSDTSTGDLLFIVNQGRVFNSNYQMMPNGDSLSPNPLKVGSTNQGSLIVPVLDSAGKFYVFTLGSIDLSNPNNYVAPALHYSVIDMDLNGGLGDVVSGRKALLLDSGPLQEGMIAIPGNNCDIWVLVHPYHDTIFKAYHITREGLDSVPVISSPGSMIGGNMAAWEGGGMSVSPDRDRIAIGSYSPSCAVLGLVPSLGGLMIAKFDPETGEVSDGIQIHDSMANYSSCFSPDGTKLYAQGITADSLANQGPAQLLQYDVSNYNQASIRASKYVVDDFHPSAQFYGLRRRGDTILVSDLRYIASPDLAGAACSFQNSAYFSTIPGTIGNVTNTTNLGTNMVYPLPPDTVYRLVLDTFVCDNLTLEAPNSYTEYRWDNDEIGPSREITGLGTYWVAYNDGCHFGVDTFVIDMADLNPVITIDVFELGTTLSYSSYQWMLNGNTIPGAINSHYTVLENGDYQVIVSDETGCIDTSEIYEVNNVGIKAIHPLANKIRVYPNPGREVIHIDAPILTQITVTTIEGRVVKSEYYENPINISDLSTGIYLIKVRDRLGNLIKAEKYVKMP